MRSALAACFRKNLVSFSIGGIPVTRRETGHYLTACSHYGGWRVSALRFFYKVRYRIGLYDHAMRGVPPKVSRIELRYGRKPSVEISGWRMTRPRKSCRNSRVVSAFRLPTRQPMIAFCVPAIPMNAPRHQAEYDRRRRCYFRGRVFKSRQIKSARPVPRIDDRKNTGLGLTRISSRAAP
jgi:hypothetical protein